MATERYYYCVIKYYDIIIIGTLTRMSIVPNFCTIVLNMSRT
jgi:hypothetical protein